MIVGGSVVGAVVGLVLVVRGEGLVAVCARLAVAALCGLVRGRARGGCRGRRSLFVGPSRAGRGVASPSG